jgi:hypothetical protein
MAEKSAVNEEAVNAVSWAVAFIANRPAKRVTADASRRLFRVADEASSVILTSCSA